LWCYSFYDVLKSAGEQDRHVNLDIIFFIEFYRSVAIYHCR
jgi:hypothetical protein